MNNWQPIDALPALTIFAAFCVANAYYEYFHSGAEPKKYQSKGDWFIGKKLDSTSGSNFRRQLTIWASVFTLAISSYVAGEAGHLGEFSYEKSQAFLAFSFVVASLSYFFYVVVFMVLIHSPSFKTNSIRLIHNTAISTAFNIITFGVLYLFTGIDDGHGCIETASITETVYFSAVTFSTLGYGDFAPCVGSRAFAGLEAIVGNIHLGVLVAALFSVIGRPEKSREP